MSYHHFTTANRYKLEFYLDESRTLGYIAAHLGYRLQTIWREIQRNRLTDKELASGRIDRKQKCITRSNNKYNYDAEAADYKASLRRAIANQTHRVLPKNTRIRNYVIKRIKQRWSPEQIAGTLKKRGVTVKGTRQDFTIAIQTIYSYINVERRDLRKYLRRRKKYKYCHESYIKKQLKEQSRSIDARPAYINKRRLIGHWEGDTVLGSKQGATGRIATFVERKSGYLMAVLIPAYTTKEKSLKYSTKELLGLTMSRKFADSFINIAKRNIKPKYLKTLTLDNGCENADYEYIESQMDKLTIYFAHPYHSWERGTNENTNGLLRQYFPKGMDFTNITQADIDKAVDEINNRPRKRLNWNTPQKLMERCHALYTSD